MHKCIHSIAHAHTHCRGERRAARAGLSSGRLSAGAAICCKPTIRARKAAGCSSTRMKMGARTPLLVQVVNQRAEAFYARDERLS